MHNMLSPHSAMWKMLSPHSTWSMELQMQRGLDNWHKMVTELQMERRLDDKKRQMDKMAKQPVGWRMAEDGKAEIKLNVPWEDGSLTAQLSDDGRSVNLSGQTCTSSSRNVELPFGPASADDLELIEFPDGVITLRATRTKPAAPPELKIIKASPEPAAPSEEQAQLTATHDREAEEKELERKFKTAVDGFAKQMASADVSQEVARKEDTNLLGEVEPQVAS